jgi:N-acyl-D-aspartate/D-glutamate deacylase
MLLSAAQLGSQTAPLDLVIRNGRVSDGTGAPARAADIGVRGGRIDPHR